MNRNIDDVLSELLLYFDLVRGVGHTTTVIRGAQNVDRATVVCADERSAANVKRQCNKQAVFTTTIEDVSEGSLRGRRMPVVVDNHAMREILWQSLCRISELRQQVEQSEKQIEVYKVQVTQLTENLDQAEQRLEVAKQGIRELQTIYNQEVEAKVQSVVAKYDKETHELRQTMAKQIHDAYSDLSVEQLAKRIVEVEREKAPIYKTEQYQAGFWLGHDRI